MLAPLNARLGVSFLLRETPSLADMAIAPFVRQFAAFLPRPAHWPPLRIQCQLSALERRSPQ